ncbi:hypothetical protein Tco_0836142, partial [Tanacetum coccineum]
AKIARRDQRIQVREEEIKKLDQEVKSPRATETKVYGLRNQTKNLGTLLEADADMKKAAKAKNAELSKELESLRVRFSDLQVNNNQLSQQVSNLQAHITEGDTEEDAPQRIRDLCPSSSQLKIPIYTEVRNSKDPWAVKEEMLLEDAIAANISRAEKKKKCMVVCRTHGVGSAHHARSDDIPISVPTIAPQGLAILLADAATQTEVSESEASLRLLRSKSLPPMYNLDWR